MSRYIDTKWLEDNAKEYSLGYYEYDEWATPLNVLDSAPSIDIVRCKECKHRGICFGRLVQGTKVVQLNFCSYGEREVE